VTGQPPRGAPSRGRTDGTPPPGLGALAGAPWVAAGRRCLAVTAACAFDPPAALREVDDPAAAVAAALDAPVEAPPLANLAAGARDVVVVVPDSSRGCPVARLLPPLLERLSQAGVGDDRIRIVVGCGLHRTTTPAERETLVGAGIAARLRVVDAQGLSPRNVRLGEIAGHGPIVIDDVVAGADLVVAVGIVEPHLYAGFSGGVKAVAVGCAGRETIAWTHHPVFLDRPEVRLCRLDGNPFQEALRAIAGATALRFALNVVVDGGGGVAGVAAGDPAAAQRRLVADHGAAWVRRHDAPFDLVVAGVPEPKDRSLYQASRAATYIGLSARPVLAPGGLIAFCAELPLGAGDGPGEINFGALLAATKRPMDLVARGCVEPLGPGGQRAYMVAKLMTMFRVGVVGASDPALVESFGLLAFESVDEAVAAARRVRGPRARVLAVADGIGTVVELAG
jgi:nickel-dependent lactate racemase